MVVSTKLLPLEFSVFKCRPVLSGDEPLGAGHTVLLAVSGGTDSIALMNVLRRMSDRWGFTLLVAHVHHGASAEVKQKNFRDRAEKLVVKKAEEMGLAVVVLRAKSETAKSRSKKLHASEEELRDLRRTMLAAHAKTVGAQLIAMGHHADDLFETRLIRLLRGTGPSGFRAMAEFVDVQAGEPIQIWRPFLKHSRRDIESYLRLKKLKILRDWMQDPSNRSEMYLRNKIRRKLIPMIEKMREGGVVSMARSFDLLADGVVEVDSGIPPRSSDVGADVNGPALERAEFMKLDVKTRRERLSDWLFQQQIKNFSKSQIEEVIKRIDTPRRRLNFTVGRRVWLVDTWIRLKPDLDSQLERCSNFHPRT